MTQHYDWRPWLVAGGALVLAALLLAFGRGHSAKMGDRTPVSITVIPVDSINLDCSSDLSFDSTRCAFDAHGKSQAVEKPLRPYVTTGRELLLLSGVFEAPDVGEWLQKARQTGSEARVTVNCQASVLGKVASIRVRWQTGAGWGTERDVPVARVSDCRVVP